MLIGAIGGLMPGVFGVGGGFITVPLMIFLGIKPSIAIFSANSQIVYASISSAVTNLHNKKIDLQICWILCIGIFLGYIFSEHLIILVTKWGYIDIFIPFVYVIFLGSIGSFMLIESMSILYKKYVKIPQIDKKGILDQIVQKLPLKINHQLTESNFSLLIPLIAAFFGGMLLTVGMSTGFVIYPVLIYILRIPIMYIISTNMFAALFALLYLITKGILFDDRFDILLCIILIFSSIVGNIIGIRIAQKTQAEELRLGLSILMLAIVGKFIFSLIKEPNQLFSII